MARSMAAPLLAGLLLAACGSIEPDPGPTAEGTILPPPSEAGSEAETATTGSPTSPPPPALPPTTVAVGTTPTPTPFTVVATRPHDTSAYTQGLLYWADRFVESTGERGESDLRVVDPETGDIIESRPLDTAALDAIRENAGVADPFFGEGLARVDDRLIQLTWTAGLALVWDLTNLELEGLFTYAGEGWGLCHDGSRLVMSNGSPTLTFRDPETFDTIGAVEVTWAGAPIGSLNELECIHGRVWANIWKDDRILVIDPTTGAVTHVLNLTELVPEGVEAGREVLNGIAHDAETDRLWVTGKNWPILYELDVDIG